METSTATRRALLSALSEGREDQAARIVDGLEDEANAALARGELEPIVAVRGRMSRLRRAAASTAPEWDGLQRMLALDRVLASAVTGLQLALRRELPVPIPGNVAEAAQRPAPKRTVRQQVLDALDDKPRRPIELGGITGVSKRQVQRALSELVRSGRVRLVAAAAEDDRAAFYQRVA